MLCSSNTTTFNVADGEVCLLRRGRECDHLLEQNHYHDKLRSFAC
jgi:hypothetical protein